MHFNLNKNLGCREGCLILQKIWPIFQSPMGKVMWSFFQVWILEERKWWVHLGAYLGYFFFFEILSKYVFSPILPWFHVYLMFELFMPPVIKIYITFLAKMRHVLIVKSLVGRDLRNMTHHIRGGNIWVYWQMEVQWCHKKVLLKTKISVVMTTTILVYLLQHYFHVARCAFSLWV